MSVSKKLWGGFFATVLLGAFLFYQLTVIRELAEGTARLATISSRVSVVGTEQLHRLDQLTESSAKYRVTEDPRYAEQFVALTALVREEFGGLDTLSLSAEEGREVERIRHLLASLESAAQSFDRIREAGSDELDVEAISATGEATVDSLRSATLALTGASRAAMLRVAERSSARAAEAEHRVWLIAAIVLTLAALLTLTAARSVSRGLKWLAVGTRRVAEGDFEYRLIGAREPEFRRLEDDFNVMIERLSELERMKKDFLAGVSHDLKGPLASIRETLAVLLDEVPGPVTERQRRLLELAGQSGERLGAMISNLLDLAQLEAEAIPYHFESNDLVQLVRGVVEEMETRFEDKGVAARLELPDELSAQFDAGRMTQVTQNLLENALAVAPVDSEIDVVLQVVEGRGQIGSHATGADRVRLEVRDRGPGVPAEMREKIFERFVRANGSGGSGVGLGLTICREIVRAHEGRIWTDGREGGGSVFSLEIPCSRAVLQPAGRQGITPQGEPE
jgi:two-component system sensor histidine kinase GlrK